MLDQALRHPPAPREALLGLERLNELDVAGHCRHTGERGFESFVRGDQARFESRVREAVVIEFHSVRHAPERLTNGGRASRLTLDQNFGQERNPTRWPRLCPYPK